MISRRSMLLGSAAALVALGPQWRAPDDFVPRPDVVYHFEAYSAPLPYYGRSPMADALPNPRRFRFNTAQRYRPKLG